ncbi:hypothetical protein RIF29_19625 [Crotalaria pallida]|uniref:PB1-like domain-containing protein n=1 Tax=Crotalaria pallida TaxID=3830 RepID=A0AAN9I4B1_CROPI
MTKPPPNRSHRKPNSSHRAIESSRTKQQPSSYSSHRATKQPRCHRVPPSLPLLAVAFAIAAAFSDIAASTSVTEPNRCASTEPFGLCPNTLIVAMHFNLIMHHGGELRKFLSVSYEGGFTSKYAKYDEHYMSYLEFVSFNYGYKKNNSMIALLPGGNLNNGSITLNDNGDVRYLLSKHKSVNSMDVVLYILSSENQSEGEDEGCEAALGDYARVLNSNIEGPDDEGMEMIISIQANKEKPEMNKAADEPRNSYTAFEVNGIVMPLSSMLLVSFEFNLADLSPI